MPVITVSCSRTINTTKEKVWECVNDFKNFSFYNPWALSEPEADMHISNPSSGEGASYTWDGKIIGAGVLTIKKVLDNKEGFDMHLDFTRPKSKGNVPYFRFKEHTKDNVVYCDVTWGLHSTFPWWMKPLLFMFKDVFERMMTQSYTLGLAMLNSHLDPSAPKVEIRHAGGRKRDAQYYVGIAFKNISEKEIANKYEEFMPAILEYAKKHDIDTSNVVAVYTHFDKRALTFDGVIGILVDEVCALPDGFISDMLPAALYNQFTHTGADDTIGHAWEVAMMGYQSLQTKAEKIMPCFERSTYRSDKEKDAHVTDIFVPVNEKKYNAIFGS